MLLLCVSRGWIWDMTPGSLGFTRVKLIPDEAAAFTKAVGMDCDWTAESGFGTRSWRYSAYIENGVVIKMFVEQPVVQNSGPDPYEVSDADTMLNWLKEQ